MNKFTITALSVIGISIAASGAHALPKGNQVIDKDSSMRVINLWIVSTKI